MHTHNNIITNRTKKEKKRKCRLNLTHPTSRTMDTAAGCTASHIMDHPEKTKQKQAHKQNEINKTKCKKQSHTMIETRGGRQSNDKNAKKSRYETKTG
jgi:hypothetical protein